MKRRIAVMVAVMLFALTACGGDTVKEDGLTPVTLCLDWTPNTNHTGFFVAQAEGYYKEAGLEVRIVQPPEDGASAVCAGGRAEFAVTAQDTLGAGFSLKEPINVTAVAALLQHNTSGIMSRAGEGLERPAGLEGHSYSTYNSAVELAVMRQVVEADGGDFSKVTLIPYSMEDEAGALREGLTDSIWVYYGWGGISANLSGVDIDYFSFKDIDATFDFYTPVLIANNSFLAQSPETAKAFIAATEKGYQYAAEHPEEAAQMLIDGDTTGALTGSEALVRESQKWISAQYIADAERWGYIDPVRWNAFYNWLGEKKLVERPIPENTGFTDEYLP